MSYSLWGSKESGHNRATLSHTHTSSANSKFYPFCWVSVTTISDTESRHHEKLCVAILVLFLNLVGRLFFSLLSITLTVGLS